MLGLQRLAVTTQLFWRAAYSSSARGSAATAATATAPKEGPATGSLNKTEDIAAGASDKTNEEVQAAEATSKKAKSAMVAAAFKSLSEKDSEEMSKQENLKNGNINIDERIINANTVNGLLSISEYSATPINRKHALKIVSILADWSSINRVKISEFENDTRFLRICRMLGRNVPKSDGAASNGKLISNDTGTKRASGFRTDDLNTVLGVAGDDEAAKLIASISLPQMVKVMSTLAQRKRRSTPLLRSLAFNISSATEHLDLKQCADVFFAMATLNFKDSVLAAKICADVQEGLPKNTDKSAVVGSILTSLGILKYRDLDILESLTQWTLKHSDICRPHDLSALFLTSAILNFKSAHIEEVGGKLVKTIVVADFNKATDWLNNVWALALLGLVDNAHLETVLSTDFIIQIQKDKFGLSPTSKMKLLNLNSYAQLLASNYKGSLLPGDSPIYDVPLAHAKSKEVLLNSVLDALKNLLPATNHVKTQVDSKMGFLIDALCLFDDKRNPLPQNKEHTNAIKVALMVVDFNDICHGPHRSASGFTSLSFNLLEKSGYRVLSIPYNEFNTSDKLLKRVQYLEGKLKTLINSKN